MRASIRRARTAGRNRRVRDRQLRHHRVTAPPSVDAVEAPEPSAWPLRTKRRYEPNGRVTARRVDELCVERAESMQCDKAVGAPRCGPWARSTTGRADSRPLGESPRHRGGVLGGRGQVTLGGRLLGALTAVQEAFAERPRGELVTSDRRRAGDSRDTRLRVTTFERVAGPTEQLCEYRPDVRGYVSRHLCDPGRSACRRDGRSGLCRCESSLLGRSDRGPHRRSGRLCCWDT